MRLGLVAVLLTVTTVSVVGADLDKDTIAAFDRYVQATERRRTLTPFLWIDGQPDPRARTLRDNVRGGGLVIESLETRENDREIGIPNGIVHHWLGTVFVRGATLQDAVALLQDYDRHATIYAPNVARSQLRARDGDRFSVFLRFSMKKVITVVVNSEHQAVFTRHGTDRASSRIVSTRIAQVEDAGSASEHELPVGRDGGYLWRLNSYWRFQERDGGVVIQCESITLTRQIPFLARAIVRPFVESIPRDTVTFTLEKTRAALERR